MQWVFDTLGISLESDTRAVRKAYARAIKACDPATEAERFQRIRQAYEWALQWAEHREAAAEHAVTAMSDSDEAADETPDSATAASLESRSPPLRGIARPSTLPEPDDARQLHGELLEESPRPRTPPLGRTARPSIRPEPSEADRLSGDVLDDLKRALVADDAPSPVKVLESFAQDVRLTSLDAKSQFELRMLILCYGTPFNIPLLDAACAAFAWETSNRHLAQTRPDLVHRMLRQQMLLRLLTERKELGILVDAVKFHARVQHTPSEPRPWQLGNVSQVIERYAAYRQELDERFGAHVIAWWREHRAPIPAKGASLAESLAHLPPPSRARAAKKPAKSATTPIFAVVLVVILLNLFSHLGQDSRPPIASARVEQSAQPPVNLGVLSAQPRQATKPFYQLSHDETAPPRRIATPTDEAAGRHDFQMATAYERGEGVPQNDVRATEFYEQSAKEGYGPAQFRLGQLFREGRNEARDEFMARHWWEMAAEQGNVGAQFALGELLARSGNHKDYEAALHWWRIAAMRGDPRSQEGMGWLCLNGLGVPQSDRVAYHWLRKASGKGDALALSELASMYEHGTAPVHSGRIAYALLTLITTRDSTVLASRDRDMARVRSSLSRAQLDYAMALAEELSAHNTFEAELTRAEEHEAASHS